MLTVINKIIDKEIKRIDKNIKYFEQEKVKKKEYLKNITKITDKIKFLDYQNFQLTTYKFKIFTDKFPKQYNQELEKLKNKLEKDIMETKIKTK